MVLFFVILKPKNIDLIYRTFNHEVFQINIVKRQITVLIMRLTVLFLGNVDTNLIEEIFLYI